MTQSNGLAAGNGQGNDRAALGGTTIRGATIIQGIPTTDTGEPGAVDTSLPSGSAQAWGTSERGPGKTSISPAVVQKVAGIAAREITGVAAMGGGVSRAFGAIRERIPGGGTSATAGVQVEVGERQAAVDLDVIVEYGVSIAELARAVRRNVTTAVERMTGLEVIEVNIAVNDIRLPEEDRPEPAAPRVE
ncbi:putative alkaline shock family protein YloU [Actinoalloteichus hymeniacidonis]|nr:putative alkaline shock family protein YloU [Actinoalloteichus hymeniacidonis]